MITTPFKTEPFTKQLEGFEISKDRDSFAYFMEMGTGKTKVTIDVLSHLWMKSEINACLILAPKGVYMNWIKNELPKHMAAPYRVAYWDSGGSKDSQNWLNYLVKISSNFNGLKIVCMNTEAIAHDRAEEFAWAFCKTHNAACIVDESTSIKTPNSKTSKAAQRIGSRAIIRRILTGTPITNRPLDLYSQCAFLGRDILGFPSFQSFKGYFADVVMEHCGNRAYPKIVGYKNINKLQSLLATFSYRVRKDECFDLPPRTIQRRYVEMTKEQVTHYKELERECMTYLEKADDTTTVNLAITQIMRMHTCLCGHIKTDGGQIVRIASNRVRDLMEVLDSVEDKIIIWCKYKIDIELVSESLTEIYGANSWTPYHGGITDNQKRSENLCRFQNDPTCRFFLATGSTGGQGLTIVEAPYMVDFSFDYDYETQAQKYERNYRYGQTKACTVIQLCVADSVDEVMLDVCDGKRSLADLILDKKAMTIKPRGLNIRMDVE